MPAERETAVRESLQVRSRIIIMIMSGILIALCAIAFGLSLFFPDRIGVRFVASHPLPAPGVISDERNERLALEARQRAALNGAGGRMPIEDAMKAIAGRGAHAFDPVRP